MAVPFEPPGPGSWDLDRSHFPGGATPIMQWAMRESMSPGTDRMFAELGVPASRIDCDFVNGFMYSRLCPLIAPDRASTRLPPGLVLKIVTRVHPAFRRRAKIAEQVRRERPSLDVVDRWHREIRPELIDRNRRLQAFDVAAADDAALQAHVVELLDVVRANCELHFWLHGHDLGPIARYLHAMLGWEIDAPEALDALAGASPTTAEPLHRLTELRDLIEAAPTSVDSLDDVRALGPRADQLLGEHLERHGHVAVTGYDITSATLSELPDVVLATIRSADVPEPIDHQARIDALRARVPAAERARFDELCADARAVMDMRDDNGPLTFEWPVGLLRRALLVAGDRLVAAGRLAHRDHVLELTPDEARRLFDRTPPADDVAARAARRAELAACTPPDTLGPTEPEPPLSVLPPVLAEGIAATKVAIEHLGMSPVESTDPLAGVGIGVGRYVGVARVADSADDAIERLEPGDILVVRATSPAFNTVLTIAGAVVTADGGAMSHAAVLSRELGIPAVIGAPGALEITDGAQIEVDADVGCVRRIA